MARFRCGTCGCEEDTALCNYWSARIQGMPPICSACDPKIGKWHDQFPRGPEMPHAPRPNALSPTGTVRSLVGLTRLADAGEKLAAANKQITTAGREPKPAPETPSGD
jgi:hypothetical protein